MSPPKVHNIVFDIGNVVVRWDPTLIVQRTLGTIEPAEPLRNAIFGHPLWLRLNRGEVTERDAKQTYADRLGLTPSYSRIPSPHLPIYGLWGSPHRSSFAPSRTSRVFSPVRAAHDAASLPDALPRYLRPPHPARPPRG